MNHGDPFVSPITRISHANSDGLLGIAHTRRVLFVHPPDFGAWAEWENDPSTAGTAQVLTQALNRWAKLFRPTLWDSCPDRVDDGPLPTAHLSFNPYRFSFLRNAAMAPHNPKTTKLEGSMAAAPTPNRPGASRPIVAGSGMVPGEEVQLSVLMVLVSRVTAPVRAITLPQLRVTPVVSVSLVCAIIVP